MWNCQNKVKIIGKGVCSKSFFENEHGDLLFLLTCWTQHYISCNVCVYI